MRILVQKFGGTSVSTHERRLMVVEKVLKAKEEGFSPVIVVSAMGRKGQPYATDTLLSLISNDFRKNNLLAADLLMNCGEIISTVVMSDEFFKNGLSAVPLTGGHAGIITNNNYSNASVISVNTKNIINILKEDKIPIIAGFQGQSEDGFMTTLGRGGSDVTASLLGVSLKAEEIQIYTDVDGIMTADPRIVSNASLIEKIGYNEVFQFADQGAKVIHPRAVEIAMQGSIPLVVKNTLNDCKGTMISSKVSGSNNIVAGITSVGKRVQITVKLQGNNNKESYITILNELAIHGISIDLINVFPMEKIFTIDSDDLEKFSIIMKNLDINYSYVEDCTKIALIGNGMRGIPGVMARILKALTKENIEILQTADSHTTIWCLVESKNVERAINALHEEFKLGK